MDDNFNETILYTKKECKETKKYYILNIDKKATLSNGFRYIKELLLQFHNLKMNEDHMKLTNAGVKVFLLFGLDYV